MERISWSRFISQICSWVSSGMVGVSISAGGEYCRIVRQRSDRLAPQQQWPCCAGEVGISPATVVITPEWASILRMASLKKSATYVSPCRSIATAATEPNVALLAGPPSPAV